MSCKFKLLSYSSQRSVLFWIHCIALHFEWRFNKNSLNGNVNSEKLPQEEKYTIKTDFHKMVQKTHNFQGELSQNFIRRHTIFQEIIPRTDIASSRSDTFRLLGQ